MYWVCDVGAAATTAVSNLLPTVLHFMRMCIKCMAASVLLAHTVCRLSEQTAEITRKIEGPKGRIQRLLWTDLNKTLISASEDGFVRRWDVEVCGVEVDTKVSM